MADVEVVSLDNSGPTVVIRARTRSQVPVTCTGCGTPSGWCHSRYDRQLNDMSLGGRAVRIELSVRRLYCENADCGNLIHSREIRPDSSCGPIYFVLYDLESEDRARELAAALHAALYGDLGPLAQAVPDTPA